VNGSIQLCYSPQMLIIRSRDNFQVHNLGFLPNAITCILYDIKIGLYVQISVQIYLLQWKCFICSPYIMYYIIHRSLPLRTADMVSQGPKGSLMCMTNNFEGNFQVAVPNFIHKPNWYFRTGSKFFRKSHEISKITLRRQDGVTERLFSVVISKMLSVFSKERKMRKW